MSKESHSEKSMLSTDLYPSQDDLLYEEEILRNPFSLKLWWRYLIARSDAPFTKRSILYERALKALPGSYKLWHAYLRERLDLVRNHPISHSYYNSLNNIFERALVTMHKMPRIWLMYLQTLVDQRLITKARRTFDRALRALPITQHDRIWTLYLAFVSLNGIPVETALRVYRRYLLYDPSHIEDFIEFLLNSGLWQEAAERLASVLNSDEFHSVKGKTKHQLWLELCEVLTKHATEVTGLNVDAIIRGGIRKYSTEVGRLWTSLADYYVRRGLFEKARDVFEEGLQTVLTVRDFTVIFESYAQFEQSALAAKLETAEEDEEDELVGMFLKGFWLNDDDDADLRLARQVELFEGNPSKQIATFAQAVQTVDPLKEVGRPHILWVAFAHLYENHNGIVNARAIFDKAVQVNYKTVDNLASVWCEWAEMELRHKNIQGALNLMRRATAQPSVEVKR